MNIILIDATSDSLTVSWPEEGSSAGTKSKRYVLQYRRGDSADDSYETLSNALSTALARKKNLTDPDRAGFTFRVGFYNGEAEDPHEWITHEQPFFLLSSEQGRMAAPVVHLGGSHSTLHIAWTPLPDLLSSSLVPTSTETVVSSAKYELQMRENAPGVAWSLISDALQGTEVRKKNLTSPLGYQFRVRSINDADLNQNAQAHSPPSNAVVAVGYAKSLQQLFPDQLLTAPERTSLVTTENVLGGKEFVLLYASAHWCGPCRQFTPKLVQWYQSLGANRTVEVVFLSADRDVASFQSYYSSMPWASIDYENDAREQLMSHIRVSGIPRLAVLDGRTGRIVEDNAVGKTLDMSRWRSLVK